MATSNGRSSGYGSGGRSRSTGTPADLKDSTYLGTPPPQKNTTPPVADPPNPFGSLPFLLIGIAAVVLIYKAYSKCN